MELPRIQQEDKVGFSWMAEFILECIVFFLTFPIVLAYIAREYIRSTYIVVLHWHLLLLNRPTLHEV